MRNQVTGIRTRALGMIAVGGLMAVIGAILVFVSGSLALPVLGIGSGVTLIGLILMILDFLYRRRHG